MTRLVRLYRSALGKKAIVAVTGGLLLIFLLLHVAGNLKVFLPDAAPGVPDIDLYARFLRTMGGPLLPFSGALWAVRVVLAVAFVLHVVCVFQLAVRNRRARPVGYRRQQYAEATAPARWMLVTGSLLLVFLVIHLLQFTSGTIDAENFVPGAVYANLDRAFSAWGYTLFYTGAMAVLALHLYHGGWSLFQTLGVDNPDRNRALRALALCVALGLALAFAAVPVAFFAGSMAPPPAVSPNAAQLDQAL